MGLLAAGSFVEGAFDVLIVLLAIELLGLGGAGVGWLNAAWGVGGLVAGAVAISLLGRGRLAAGLASGALAAGACLLLLSVLPEELVAVAFGIFVVIGLGYGLIEIAGVTLLQRMTSDEVLGRAFAVVESGYGLMNGVGAMASPLLIELFGLRGALVAIGLLMPALVGLRGRALTRLEAGAAVPEEAFRLLRSLPLFAPLPLGMVENLSQRLVPMEARSGARAPRALPRAGREHEAHQVVQRAVVHSRAVCSCLEGGLAPVVAAAQDHEHDPGRQEADADGQHERQRERLAVGCAGAVEAAGAVGSDPSPVAGAVASDPSPPTTTGGNVCSWL